MGPCTIMIMVAGAFKNGTQHTACGSGQTLGQHWMGRGSQRGSRRSWVPHKGEGGVRVGSGGNAELIPYSTLLFQPAVNLQMQTDMGPLAWLHFIDRCILQSMAS